MILRLLPVVPSLPIVVLLKVIFPFSARLILFESLEIALTLFVLDTLEILLVSTLLLLCTESVEVSSVVEDDDLLVKLASLELDSKLSLCVVELELDPELPFCVAELELEVSLVDCAVEVSAKTDACPLNPK